MRADTEHAQRSTHRPPIGSAKKPPQAICAPTPRDWARHGTPRRPRADGSVLDDALLQSVRQLIISSEVAWVSLGRSQRRPSRNASTVSVIYLAWTCKVADDRLSAAAARKGCASSTDHAGPFSMLDQLKRGAPRSPSVTIARRRHRMSQALRCLRDRRGRRTGQLDCDADDL